MRSLRAALWGSPSASPPSLPSRQLLSAAGPKPSTLAARAAAEEAAQNTRPFVFVSTFKWEMRKGWDVLLSAYLSEFNATDNVELYILTKPFANSGSNFKDTMHK